MNGLVFFLVHLSYRLAQFVFNIGNKLNKLNWYIVNDFGLTYDGLDLNIST